MMRSLLRASALLCLMPLAVPSVVVLPEALLRPHEGVVAEYEEDLQLLVAFMGVPLRPDGGPAVMVCRNKPTVYNKLAVS